MALIHINHHPNRQQLRTFALCWLVFFASFALWAWWRQASTGLALGLAAAAVLLPLVGWFWTELLRWTFIGLSYLTFPMGVIVSFTLLFVVYYFVFTPYGWLMRRFGYDPLRRARQQEATSYWVKRDAPRSMDSYFRQY